MTVTLKVRPVSVAVKTKTTSSTVNVPSATMNMPIRFTDTRSTTACFDSNVFDSTVFDTDIIVDAEQVVKVKSEAVTVKVK